MLDVWIMNRLDFGRLDGGIFDSSACDSIGAPSTSKICVLCSLRCCPVKIDSCCYCGMMSDLFENSRKTKVVVTRLITAQARCGKPIGLCDGYVRIRGDMLTHSRIFRSI